MITKEELLKSKEYWLAIIQNQLFNHLEEYMIKEGLNRSSLADQLGVTKGYISQVLNGDYDHRLSKFVELLIATNKVPVLVLEDLDKQSKKTKKASNVTIPSSPSKSTGKNHKKTLGKPASLLKK